MTFEIIKMTFKVIIIDIEKAATPDKRTASSNL